MGKEDQRHRRGERQSTELLADSDPLAAALILEWTRPRRTYYLYTLTFLWKRGMVTAST